jgi:FKBP-type peptidyl-prolyl cis-trans isomerase SlyD
MNNSFVSFLAAGVLLSAGFAHAEDALVAIGKKVKFDYTLTVDDKLVETSKGKSPLEYNPGRGEIISGLEKELMGLKAGDAKTVVVKPEEGYGVLRADAFREFDRSQLPKGMDPKVGMMLEMQDEKGTSFPAKLAEVKEKTVKLDFNHPLAGKTLTFDVKVVSVE